MQWNRQGLVAIYLDILIHVVVKKGGVIEGGGHESFYVMHASGYSLKSEYRPGNRVVSWEGEGESLG